MEYRRTGRKRPDASRLMTEQGIDLAERSRIERKRWIDLRKRINCAGRKQQEVTDPVPLDPHRNGGSLSRLGEGEELIALLRLWRRRPSN